MKQTITKLSDMYNEIGKILEEKGDMDVAAIASHSGMGQKHFTLECFPFSTRFQMSEGRFYDSNLAINIDINYTNVELDKNGEIQEIENKKDVERE